MEPVVQPVQLVIAFNPADGSVGFSGPLDNKILCFGLLEMAKIAIMNHKIAEQSRVELAPPGSRVAPVPPTGLRLV